MAACVPTLSCRNWELWVPAQLINFRFVGPAYQVLVVSSCLFDGFASVYRSVHCYTHYPCPVKVLFSNIVGLFWTVYLSVVAHHDDADGSGDEK
jgi:hypothetical protein